MQPHWNQNVVVVDCSSKFHRNAPTTVNDVNAALTCNLKMNAFIGNTLEMNQKTRNKISFFSEECYHVLTSNANKKFDFVSMFLVKFFVELNRSQYPQHHLFEKRSCCFDEFHQYKWPSNEKYRWARLTFSHTFQYSIFCSPKLISIDVVFVCWMKPLEISLV